MRDFQKDYMTLNKTPKAFMALAKTLWPSLPHT